MENLLTIFQKSLHRLNIAKKDRLLLAVSGGLDSVVLAALCAASELDFAIAHVNFHLRGEESDRDELFVRNLAMKYNKAYHFAEFDTAKYADTKKCSVQVAARELRYNWFNTFLGKGPDKFQFLFTAHHLDDNIETLLMHFFRGTGISGLTGIPEKNGYIVRPLLSQTKNQLKIFATSQNLEWVEDSSNSSDDYTRNYFRNQLIPSLETIFPNLQQNLEKNLQRFSEAAQLYHQAVQQYKKKLLVKQGAEFHIPILLLKKAFPLNTVLYEILKDFQFSPDQTQDISQLMDSTNGKYVASSSHRIIKNRRWLVIAPLEDINISHIVIDKDETTVVFPEGKLHLNRKEIDGSGYISVPGGAECLDLDNIKFPLILRRWKTGDYFYPLGMKKKKKLARFFIDLKLSKTAKEKIWVLVSDSQIISVVGHRIDNRFAIGTATKNLLIIRNETDFVPA